MGYYPSKIACLLNIIIMLGYGMIDCLVGGQVLSAVSGGRMTVIVGIIIIAIMTWAVVLFGMTVFHIYERYVNSPIRILSRETYNYKDGPGSPSLSPSSSWSAVQAPNSTPRSAPPALLRRSQAIASLSSHSAYRPPSPGRPRVLTSSSTSPQPRRHGRPSL